MHLLYKHGEHNEPHPSIMSGPSCGAIIAGVNHACCNALFYKLLHQDQDDGPPHYKVEYQDDQY